MIQKVCTTTEPSATPTVSSHGSALSSVESCHSGSPHLFYSSSLNSNSPIFQSSSTLPLQNTSCIVDGESYNYHHVWEKWAMQHHEEGIVGWDRNIGQSLQIMDEGASALWVDEMINELKKNSPNVPVYEILKYLHNSIYCCSNPHIKSAVESKLLSLTQFNVLPNQNIQIIDKNNGSITQMKTGGSMESSFENTYKEREYSTEEQRLNQTESLPLHHQFSKMQETLVRTDDPRFNESELEGKEDSGTLRNIDSPSTASSFSEEEGLHLLALLLQCAEAVSEDNHEEANSILPQIYELSSPHGNSVHRVAAYLAEALSCRLISSYLGIYSPIMNESRSQSIVSAFQVYNGISPFVKFSHFTANQAIQQVFQGENRVHIIDLDIMQGLQWPGLFHILASRPGSPPYVRITGLGTSMEALEATGKRLSNFAETLGIPFEFHAVSDKAGNINEDLERLKVRKGDALAVHWLQHSLYDVTGSDMSTLWLLRRLCPKVITMVEQDLSHVGSFLNRFVEAIHYYSAVFDSLGAAYPEDSHERHVVEQQLLSCEIKNILAVGGPARTGEVKIHNWRDQLQQAGFSKLSLAGNAAAQATLLLGMFPCKGYTLVEESGTLRIGWKNICLLTASAWRPAYHAL